MSEGDVEEALARHAAGTVDAASDALADLIWRYSHQRQIPALVHACRDIVHLIETIPNDGLLDLRLAYSISELQNATTYLALVAIDEVVRSDAALAAWTVSCAWTGRLSGDIESIADHVRLEAFGTQSFGLAHSVSRESEPNHPSPTSPYYQMELNEIAARNYPTTPVNGPR